MVNDSLSATKIDPLREAMANVERDEDGYMPLPQDRPRMVTREEMQEREAWVRKLRLPMEQAFLNLQLSATGKIELDEISLAEMDAIRGMAARAYAKVMP